MKIRRVGSICLVAISAAGLSGCAETRRLVITEPVGPLPTSAKPAGTIGQLIVYSAWDGLDTLDAEHRKHTSYTVRSEPKTKVIHVRNRCGSFEGDAQVVPLAPGRYWIEAEATNVGPVRVPAVVREGETTLVYLDGTTEPAAPWPRGTNWIRQPNGLIVGWRDRGNQATMERASISK